MLKRKGRKRIQLKEGGGKKGGRREAAEKRTRDRPFMLCVAGGRYFKLGLYYDH